MQKVWMIVLCLFLVFAITPGSVQAQKSHEERLLELEARITALETTPPAYGLWKQDGYSDSHDAKGMVIFKWTQEVFVNHDYFVCNDAQEFVTIQQSGLYLIHTQAQFFSSPDPVNVFIYVNDRSVIYAHRVPPIVNDTSRYGTSHISLSYPLKNGDKVSLRILPITEVPGTRGYAGATLSIVKLGPWHFDKK